MLQKKSNKTVTIRGEQSNYCLATATSLRMIGIELYLILWTKRVNSVKKIESEKEEVMQNDSFGYTGNILFDRIIGTHIYTVHSGEYGRIRNNALIDRLSLALHE